MTFNSVPYLAFLAMAVAICWLLPASCRRVFVLVASLAFYASWGLIFVWLPIFVAGVVYVIGRRITADSSNVRKWMCMGIASLLVLLVFFKYRGFFLDNLHLAGFSFGSGPSSLATAIAFPVGVSFYTFEAIAYLIDLRQGRVKMPGFMDLCLFFLFWPNVLSGPIVRARELVPQLDFRKPFEARFVFAGMDRVIWGLVQKNVLANVLGVWVDKGFAPGAAGVPTTIDGWFLAIAFALQIYFDFAGYSNMAIGTAQLLGVTLPENFHQPYHAATPAEFWARWHMTLSRWIRDYLFFPVNAKWIGAPVPLYLSLVVVMGLVGLWHGAGWGFIVWGLLHGAYLVIYRMYEGWKTGQASVEVSRVASVIWRMLTLVAVIVAWVPFRAATLQKAGAILGSMFYRFGGGREFGGGFYSFTVAMVIFCVVEPMVMRKLNEMDERGGAEGLLASRVLVRPIAYLLGFVLFLLLDGNGAAFIYSQF